MPGVAACCQRSVWIEPRAELKCDVLVRVGAAVASCAGDESLGPCQADPLFGRQEETVASGFVSNSLEFEGIKTGVVDALPDTQEEHGILVLEPLLDESSRTVKVPHPVGERDVIALRLLKDSDGGALDFDGASLGFAHGV